MYRAEGQVRLYGRRCTGSKPRRCYDGIDLQRKPRLDSLHAIDLRLLGGALLILTGNASSL
jgi:hypothetical protein